MCRFMSEHVSIYLLVCMYICGYLNVWVSWWVWKCSSAVERVDVFLFMLICMCEGIWECMYVQDLCLWAHTTMSLCWNKFVIMFLWVNGCLSTFIHMSECCKCVYLCELPNGRIYFCEWLCKCVFGSMSTCKWMCKHVFTCVYMHIWGNVCTCDIYE